MNLNEWLREISNRLRDGERPTTVSGPFGEHGVTYGIDYEDVEQEYATIGFVIDDPDEKIYVEIEDDTYGQLQGFRIYL